MKRLQVHIPEDESLMCTDALIHDAIRPGEACLCDNCGERLDLGHEVYVDLPAAKVFCSQTCYLIHGDAPDGDEADDIPPG